MPGNADVGISGIPHAPMSAGRCPRTPPLRSPGAPGRRAANPRRESPPNQQLRASVACFSASAAPPPPPIHPTPTVSEHWPLRARRAPLTLSLPCGRQHVPLVWAGGICFWHNCRQRKSSTTDKPGIIFVSNLNGVAKLNQPEYVYRIGGTEICRCRLVQLGYIMYNTTRGILQPGLSTAYELVPLLTVTKETRSKHICIRINLLCLAAAARWGSRSRLKHGGMVPAMYGLCTCPHAQ
eukprot:gene23432-biopygen10340